MSAATKTNGGDKILSIYLTNLGKYSEGFLVGEWVELPVSDEELSDVFKRIGIDGTRYEEYFITDYESTIEGLIRCFGEYESVADLNKLAELLTDLSEYELKKFDAILELEGCSSIDRLIQFIDDMDTYSYYPNIKDCDELGRYFINELDSLDIPDNITMYFDYEAYGRDIQLSSGGIFTNNGYIEKT